jgi:hypothetical protein
MPHRFHGYWRLQTGCIIHAIGEMIKLWTTLHHFPKGSHSSINSLPSTDINPMIKVQSATFIWQVHLYVQYERRCYIAVLLTLYSLLYGSLAVSFQAIHTFQISFLCFNICILLRMVYGRWDWCTASQFVDCLMAEGTDTSVLLELLGNRALIFILYSSFPQFWTKVCIHTFPS